VIECHRPCGQCDYVHVFVDRDDDADACPKCGGILYPIATIITEVTAAADRIERALVDGQEANACWSRIDDAGPGGRPVVRDIAKRLAEAALIPPIVEVLDRARVFARASVSTEETAASSLHSAARALEAPCRVCGARVVALDAKHRCATCTPTIEAEVDLSERCRRALAVFDARDPKSFTTATREIVADQPAMTVIEFFERALGEWDPAHARRTP